MTLRPPIATRTDTRCPYTSLFRSCDLGRSGTGGQDQLHQKSGNGRESSNRRVKRNIRDAFIRTFVRRPRSGWHVVIHFSASSPLRSEEHTSELQSLMRISYAVFCLKKKKNITKTNTIIIPSHYTHE